MKDKFVMCLSPITAGVTLVMAIAVVFNAYFCVAKVVDGFDWKVGVYVLVEVVAAVAVPGVAVSTDIIVGFPGETEEMFAESLEYIRSLRFARMHVFPYSPRTGTPAASMPNQVPDPVKKDRVHRLQKLGEEMSAVVTGKGAGIMNADASAVLNAIKHMAGISDEIYLLSPIILEPIVDMKKNVLGIAEPVLSLDEVLLALSICAAPLLKKSLNKRYGKEYPQTLVQKADVVYRDMLRRVAQQIEFQQFQSTLMIF